MASSEVEGSGSGSSLPNYDYDKSICIRFLDVNSRYQEKEWYLMDLSNMKKRKRKRKRESHDEEEEEEFRLFSKKKVSKLSTIVGMGSCIISIGGGKSRDSPCAKVWCYDTTSDPYLGGWEKRASTCIPRSIPAAAVLNGKLYVMGGIFFGIRSKLKVWGESFDPSVGTWSTVREPPFPVVFANGLKCVALEVAQIIVLVSFINGGILLYDAVLNKWKVFRQNIKINGYIGGLGAAGKTMYWYYKGLHAYDFDGKQQFFGRIKGLSRHKDHLNYGDIKVKLTSYVFHLSGNLFCLLWGCCDYVHCRTFQVTKCIHGSVGCLTASVVSHKSHKFDSNLCFHDATLLDRKLGEEIAGGAYEVPTTVMASIKEEKRSTFFSSSIPKYDYGKSVCILVKKFSSQMQWFMEDCLSGDNEEGSARPFSEERCAFSCAIAGVGSNLYCFAGELCSSRPKVLCYDASNPHHGWKEGGSTLTCRSNPHAVVLKGKVYIMGGLPDYDYGPWAEVFDPISRKSLELPPPPPSFQPDENHLICAAFEGEERIVVASPFSTRVLLFDAVSMTWHIFDEQVDTSSYIGGEGIVGVAGKTIYWYSMGWLYAYDFDAKLEFFGRIKRLKGQKEYLYDPEPLIRTHVFHLSGDLFCLLYLKGGYLHCNIFKVVKYRRRMKGRLRAFVVSYKFKKLDDSDILFLNATLLDKKLGEGNAGDDFEAAPFGVLTG